LRCPAPLGTGRASLPASGSSKPSGPVARSLTIRSIQTGSSSGPFTTTCVAVSNLSVGSGVIVIFFCWAHLTASARFRVRAPGPVSGRLCGTNHLEEAVIVSRFPVAFRPPAFASRSSDARRGLRPSSRSAYRTTARTPMGLPRSARMSYDRGGCPLDPEDDGAHPDRKAYPAGACRFPATSPYIPATSNPSARPA